MTRGTRILNFGTSAYLKLLTLNARPRDTEIRNRLLPSKGGYDYYKAMRSIGTRYASGGITWEEAIAALNGITKDAERKDATAAVKQLAEWVSGRSIVPFPSVEPIARSPSGLFSVRFQPDFEIVLSGMPTLVHIWNTQRPVPRLREAIGVMGLFCDEELTHQHAILSLRSRELFVALNVESSRQLARLQALAIEKRILWIREQLADDDSDRPGRSEIGKGH